MFYLELCQLLRFFHFIAFTSWVEDYMMGEVISSQAFTPPCQNFFSRLLIPSTEGHEYAILLLRPSCFFPGPEKDRLRSSDCCVSWTADLSAQILIPFPEERDGEHFQSESLISFSQREEGGGGMRTF